MAETLIAWHSMALTNASRSGFPTVRASGAETGAMACYLVYATGDGRFISLGAEEKHFGANFYTAMERPNWIERQSEPMPQTELIVQVRTSFASQPPAYWQDKIDAVDCCFEVALEPHEISKHPHVVARQMARDNIGRNR
jgi:alpha-methylacyl-CoA racemase